MNRSPWRLEEVDGSPWRLEEVNGGDEQYPVESRFAVRHTPPDEQDPRFDRRRSVSSVLRYATPLPINMTPVSIVGGPFPPFCAMRGLVSIACSVQAGWLPMNTATTQFLRSNPAMDTSHGRTYAQVGVRDPARIYIHGRIFFLAPWSLYVRVHATCAPLLRHVRAATSTSIYVHTSSRPE